MLYKSQREGSKKVGVKMKADHAGRAGKMQGQLRGRNDICDKSEESFPWALLPCH